MCYEVFAAHGACLGDVWFGCDRLQQWHIYGSLELDRYSASPVALSALPRPFGNLIFTYRCAYPYAAGAGNVFGDYSEFHLLFIAP